MYIYSTRGANAAGVLQNNALHHIRSLSHKPSGDQTLRSVAYRAKGSFHDAMQSKLKQLARTWGNEVTSLDFDAIAAQLLVAEPNESPSHAAT